MNRPVFVISLAAAVVLAAGIVFAGAPATANGGGVQVAHSAAEVANASPALKGRHHAMKAISKNFKVIRRAAKEGRIDAKMAQRAEVIRANARKFPSLLPKGSDNEELSRAKPEIWTQWSKFEKLNNRLVKAAAALERGARAGDKGAANAAIKDIRATCKGCHKPFRKPKKK